MLRKINSNQQKQRFLSNNWDKAEVLDMMSVYNYLPPNDRKRLVLEIIFFFL